MQLTINVFSLKIDEIQFVNDVENDDKKVLGRGKF